MSLIKSPVFAPPSEPEEAREPEFMSNIPEIATQALGGDKFDDIFKKTDQVEPFAEEGNFLERISRHSAQAKRHANVLRRHSNAVTATALSRLDEGDIVELISDVASSAMQEMGFDLESEGGSIDVIAPVFLRAASDAVAQLSRHCSTKDELREAAMKASRAMVLVARNRTLARFSQENFPSDLGMRTAIKASMVNAMSTMAADIAQFPFLMKTERAMKHASDQIAQAFEKNAPHFLDGCTAKASRVMLAQSLLSNAAEVYRGMWQAEGRRLMPKIRQALGVAKDDKQRVEAVRQHVMKELEKLDTRYAERFSMLIQLSSCHSDDLTQAPDESLNTGLARAMSRA